MIKHIVFMSHYARATLEQCEFVCSRYGKASLPEADVAAIRKMWQDIVLQHEKMPYPYGQTCSCPLCAQRRRG